MDKRDNSLITDLQGKWTVTSKGLGCPMNLLGDTKVIEGQSGFNIMQGKEWGYFSIEFVYPNRDGETLILNYDDPRNNELLRKVVDVINKDKDGWSGIFYLAGQRVFTFRLDRE